MSRKGFGRQSSVDAQGNTTLTDLDTGNAEPWTKSALVFDVNKKPVSETPTNDDSKQVEIFDKNASNPWSFKMDNYNAAGQLATETVRNDNGTATTQSFDIGNRYSWSNETDSFDAAGRRTLEAGTNDNASRWITAFDAVNVQAWKDYTQNFDAQNRVTEQLTHNDVTEHDINNFSSAA